jgi:hypothetical protein
MLVAKITSSLLYEDNKAAINMMNATRLLNFLGTSMVAIQVVR